jgi:hypothetical protein
MGFYESRLTRLDLSKNLIHKESEAKEFCENMALYLNHNSHDTTE